MDVAQKAAAEKKKQENKKVSVAAKKQLLADSKLKFSAKRVSPLQSIPPVGGKRGTKLSKSEEEEQKLNQKKSKPSIQAGSATSHIDKSSKQPRGSSIAPSVVMVPSSPNRDLKTEAQDLNSVCPKVTIDFPISRPQNDVVVALAQRVAITLWKDSKLKVLVPPISPQDLENLGKNNVQEAVLGLARAHAIEMGLNELEVIQKQMRDELHNETTRSQQLEKDLIEVKEQLSISQRRTQDLEISSSAAEKSAQKAIDELNAKLERAAKKIEESKVELARRRTPEEVQQAVWKNTETVLSAAYNNVREAGFLPFFKFLEEKANSTMELLEAQWLEAKRIREEDEALDRQLAQLEARSSSATPEIPTFKEHVSGSSAASGASGQEVDPTVIGRVVGSWGDDLKLCL